MANVTLKILTTEWVDATTEYGLTSGKDYLIQNRGGADFCLALDSVTAPQEDDVDGVLIPSLMQAHYKAGSGNLYVRAYSGTCSINISEAE
jgi:hypothetical protein